MLKIYKKTIFFGSSNPRLQGPNLAETETPKLSKLLTIPAMLAGALATTVFLSAFLAFLVIPGSIFGIIAWRAWRKAQTNNSVKESLEAEYTVIKDNDQK